MRSGRWNRSAQVDKEHCYGHRVEVRGVLAGPERNGLKAKIEPGHRSVVYCFRNLDSGQEQNACFGAVVEEVRSGGMPGGEISAIVRFWAVLAREYATSGAEFEFWYGRVVGHGQVVRVCE